MVSPKVNTRSVVANHLDKLRKEMEDNTVRFFWEVIEHTPACEPWTQYDLGTPEKNVTVSPQFDSSEDALEWLLRHRPDPGNSLYVQKYRVVKQTVYRTYPA